MRGILKDSGIAHKGLPKMIIWCCVRVSQNKTRHICYNRPRTLREKPQPQPTLHNKNPKNPPPVIIPKANPHRIAISVLASCCCLSLLVFQNTPHSPFQFGPARCIWSTGRGYSASCGVHFAPMYIYIYIYLFIYIFIYLYIYLFIYWGVVSGCNVVCSWNGSVRGKQFEDAKHNPRILRPSVLRTRVFCRV